MKIRYLGFVLIFLLCLSSFQDIHPLDALAQGSTLNSPWPTFHQNSLHTGSSFLPGPKTNNTKWKLFTGGYVESYPALSPDGLTVYFGTTSGYLYALDASNGAIKWKILAGGYSLFSSPAIDPVNGTIYFSSNSQTLYAINPTGTIKWEYSIGSTSKFASSPVVGPDGTIYLGSDNGYLYAFNSDGSRKWYFNAGSAIFPTPIVSLSGSVIFGTIKGDLYSISASSGSLQWNFTTKEGPIINSAALSTNSDSVYFDVFNTYSFVNYLYSLSSSSGELQWVLPNNASSSYTPSIDSDGVIYIGHVLAVSPSGSPKWSLDYDSTLLRSSPVVGGPNNLVYFDSGITNTLYAVSTTSQTQVWNFTARGASFSTPLIAQSGTVYVGDDDGNFYSISSLGKMNWSYHTGDPLSPSLAIGSRGTIYVGGYDNNLYAYNSSNGVLEWNYTTSGAIVSSPAIASDGTIYVGSEDGNLYALYPNGTLKWSYSAGGPILSSPTIGLDGTIYFGDYAGYVYALTPSSGHVKWSYLTSDSVVSSPAISEDGTTVYVGSYDNTVTALSSSTGQLKWSFDTNDWIVSSPAVGPDGTVYVGSFDGNLYAIASSGSLKWHFPMGAPIVSSPALGANGIVYIGSNNGNLYAIYSSSGLIDRQFQGGGYVYFGGVVDSSPAIDSTGAIYFGDSNGSVYALSSSGSNLWKFNTNSSIIASLWNHEFQVGVLSRLFSPNPVITCNTLYFTTLNGYLYAIGSNSSSSCSDLVSPATTTSMSSNGPGLSNETFSILVVLTIVALVIATSSILLRARKRGRK